MTAIPMEPPLWGHGVQPASDACDIPPRANRKKTMKISSGNKQSRGPSNPARPSGPHHPSSTIHHPRYALTKHIAFWHLTFNGQKACFDHEQGAYYVAYLLLNPPSEPIHGMALEIKSLA